MSTLHLKSCLAGHKMFQNSTILSEYFLIMLCIEANEFVYVEHRFQL